MAQTKAEGLEGESRDLIRADFHGRCRYTQEFRREAVAAFERSGLSGIQFARQCGVKYSTFAYWVKVCVTLSTA